MASHTSSEPAEATDEMQQLDSLEPIAMDDAESLPLLDAPEDESVPLMEGHEEPEPATLPPTAHKPGKAAHRAKEDPRAFPRLAEAPEMLEPLTEEEPAEPAAQAPEEVEFAEHPTDDAGELGADETPMIADAGLELDLLPMEEAEMEAPASAPRSGNPPPPPVMRSGPPPAPPSGAAAPAASATASVSLPPLPSRTAPPPPRASGATPPPPPSQATRALPIDEAEEELGFFSLMEEEEGAEIASPSAEQVEHEASPLSDEAAEPQTPLHPAEEAELGTLAEFGEHTEPEPQPLGDEFEFAAEAPSTAEAHSSSESEPLPLAEEEPAEFEELPSLGDHSEAETPSHADAHASAHESSSSSGESSHADSLPMSDDHSGLEPQELAEFESLPPLDEAEEASPLPGVHAEHSEVTGSPANGGHSKPATSGDHSEPFPMTGQHSEPEVLPLLGDESGFESLPQLGEDDALNALSGDAGHNTGHHEHLDTDRRPHA